MTTTLSDPRIETARKEIEATRNEVNVRLQQRDNALFAYLAGAGVLGGVAFSSNPTPEILLIIPYLSVAVAAIVSQHHTVIGRREAFIATHLMPYLKTLEADSPFKEGVLKNERYTMRDINTRTIAHAFTLILPAAFALIWNFSLSNGSSRSWAWWSAIVSTVATAWFVWQSHMNRAASAKDTEQAQL